MTFNYIKNPLLIIMFALFTGQIHAGELQFDVIGVDPKFLPIAVAPLTGENALKDSITPIIRADLERSGRFKLIDAPLALPDAPPNNLQEWKSRGSNSLALGGVQLDSAGNATIRLRLYDTVTQKLLTGGEMRARSTEMRHAAHQFADMIYEALTGDKGVFSTRIAYVTKAGSRYELQVADADGFGAQMVFGSNEPIMSPTWSPEGRRIAYVSFERKKPIVIVQDVYSGARKTVAAFKGSNSAPAWSADGNSLAVTLTLGGQSQIYRVPADGGGEPTRLSESSGIDTEANFSPDGQSIAFTSDRGGSPQIYLMSSLGGAAQRLTFDGSYNVSPRFSRDGKSLAFVRRDGGRFRVAIMDMTTRNVTPLTDGNTDESPTFAPNGRMLLYATEQGGRGVLAAVSSDGTVKQKLSTTGNVREPAWGPFAQPLSFVPMIPGLSK